MAAANDPPEPRRAKWTKYQHAHKICRKASKRARKRLYDATQDERAKDPNGEIRRMACNRARENRSHCALKKDRMAEYEAHFLTTFGAEPTGTDRPDLEILDQTNPEHDRVPTPRDGMILDEDVELLLMNAPTGKAPGEDGIHGEMLRYAASEMKTPVTTLFRIITSLCCIPDVWLVANVALVWKKKGDNADVKQYRPISLTSRLRMVYERVLRPHVLHRVNRMLDMAQGGFREVRSTMDQVYTLHELIDEHPDTKVAYLDIATAYDCTNRELMWTDLFTNDTDPNQEVTLGWLGPILRALFDYNTATLLIAGTKSRPIAVRRGLLQGTVLAPHLFNVHINSLPSGLRHDFQDNCFRIGAVLVNSLLFADDTALIARNWRLLQQMMDWACNWGRRRGVKFHPKKTQIVGSVTQRDVLEMERNQVQDVEDLEEGAERFRLVMDGEQVPVMEQAEYLGMVMDRRGVNMPLSCAKRMDRAKNMLAFIRNRGGNAFGFRIAISLALYVSFVRAMLEYGLALRPLTDKEIAPLEKLQVTALRTLFSVPKNTSIAALHLISAIPPMKQRNLTLNAAYMYRLHQYRDSNNLTLHTYRHCLERQVRPRTRCLTHLALSKNPLFIGLQRAALIFRPLTPLDRLPPILNIAPEPAVIGDQQYDEWLQQSMTALQDASTSRMAKILPIPISVKHRHPLIRSRANLNRTEFRTLCQWLLGRVCNHQDCQKCGGAKCLSRQHGIECAQVEAEVRGIGLDLTPNTAQVRYGATVIDIAISSVKFTPMSAQIRTLVRCINKIQKECAGYTIMDDPLSSTVEQEVARLTEGLDLAPAMLLEAATLIRNTYKPAKYILQRQGRDEIRRGRQRGRGRRGQQPADPG